MQRLAELAEQNFYDERADAVTLLTIHASKGLEFERVFIIAAEAGILPLASKFAKFAKALQSPPDQLAEERRLFYVAVTRAKSRLDILHARFRAGEPAEISPFLSGLPSDILPRAVDPSLESQQRTLRRRRQKHAQASLF
jgi:superfamily I DNA/RNA helicase